MWFARAAGYLTVPHLRRLTVAHKFITAVGKKTKFPRRRRFFAIRSDWYYIRLLRAVTSLRIGRHVWRTRTIVPLEFHRPPHPPVKKKTRRPHEIVDQTPDRFGWWTLPRGSVVVSSMVRVERVDAKNPSSRNITGRRPVSFRKRWLGGREVVSVARTVALIRYRVIIVFFFFLFFGEIRFIKIRAGELCARPREKSIPRETPYLYLRVAYACIRN